jgi:hypothetical protein
LRPVTGVVLASLLKIFEGGSAVVVALVGTGSLAAAAYTIYRSRRDTKTARTFEYLQRLFGLEFAPLNTQVLLFLATGKEAAFWYKAKVPSMPTDPPTPEEKWAAYRRLDIERQANVNLVLNFYEELSGSYLEGLLDEKAAGNMLIPVAVAAWDAGKWLIEKERERAENESEPEVAKGLMKEWQRLYERHKDGAPPVPTGLRDRLRRLRWGYATLLIPLGAVLAALGAVVAVALGGESFRDGAASFLFAGAAACLFAAAVALALSLNSTRRRIALVAATLTATLSIGITATLALDSSRGPRGHHGEQGEPGKPGKEGKEGGRGPEGERGGRGRRGGEGERGPRGKRGKQGLEGERGPRGLRGPPGYVS